MTSLRSLAIATAFAAVACSDELATPDHAHDHGPGGEVPAELPIVASKLILPTTTGHRTVDTVVADGFDGPAPEHVKRVTQRVRLLSATGEEPAFQAARDALTRIGVPFRAVIATREDVTTNLLGDGVNACHFNAVLFATASLAYDSGGGTWVSALSPDEWTRLAAFEAQCDAREAIWYAWPSAELGMSVAGVFESTSQLTAHVRDASFFTRVAATAEIPYRHVFGYKATILDPSRTRALVDDGAGGVLLALHEVSPGREILVSTTDHSPYLVHSLALEYDMIRWLTRGMFLGKKRAYLAPQVDDLFLDNDLWIIGEGNTGAVNYRITGADLDTFLAWQDGFRARLPAGSAFTTSMAFNGAGTQPGRYDDATLLARAQAAGDDLLWINHTWNHINMDEMTYEQARDAVDENCALASTLSLPGFSCADLVTPQVSGLDNPAAVGGVLAAGVRYVVSDTSLTEAYRPHNPGSNPSFNVGRASPSNPQRYQVPRHPTFVFYDASNPAELVDEYNHIYRSYWGRDLTYEELTQVSTDYGVFYLLQGDIDPLMFHQANLRDYGAGRSLYGDWLDAVANRFFAISTAPVQTLTQIEIGEAMKERGRLDACVASATLLVSASGRKLELRSQAGCTIPVTGLAAPSHGTVEVYGDEPTTSFTMPAGGGVLVVPLP